MFAQAIIAFASLLSIGTTALNVIWIAVLTFPFRWLWNWTLVPLIHAPEIGYRRAFGVLLLWFVLHLVANGVKLSATLRDLK